MSVKNARKRESYKLGQDRGWVGGWRVVVEYANVGEDQVLEGTYQIVVAILHRWRYNRVGGWKYRKLR